MNGHFIGFRLHTQKLESPYTENSIKHSGSERVNNVSKNARRIYLFMSKVLLDEMDKNDQLIGEVYSKGDVLLQVISGKTKATVESELNQLEEDWAEFCQDALAVKGVTEQTIQMWNEFDENRDKLAEWLGELERAYAEAFIGPANLEALREETEKNKVRLTRTFAISEMRKELQRRIAHVRYIKILR